MARCDRKATGWQDSMPYCNKHWLRIYTNGDVRLRGTGVTGVSKTPNGKYRARIMVDRKEIYLGTFETLKEAAIARKNGETKYFGEFSRNHN